MSFFKSITKFGGLYRSINVARFSASTCLQRQTLEEKLGLEPRPKKPSTPFIRFVNNIRSEIVKKQPAIKVTELAKIASERWKKMDENERNLMRKEYQKELCQYQEVLKEYDHKLGSENRDKILMAKETMKLRKEKLKLKKRREGLGCPKRPPTAFLVYLKEKIAARDSGVPYSEFVMQISNEWKSLPEDQKVRYTNLHKKEMEEYKVKMAKWEKEMTNKGDSEVHSTESIGYNDNNSNWKQMSRKLFSYFKR